MRKICAAIIVFVILACVGVTVDEEPYCEIQDNSFLIDEAYNQEDGVIQHIQTFQYLKGDKWAYTFTQEWSVPTQAHQFSYTTFANSNNFIPIIENPFWLDSRFATLVGSFLHSINHFRQSIKITIK